MAEGSLLKKGHLLPSSLMKGPALLGGGGRRSLVGVGSTSRNFGSVGSLNVFGKGGNTKVKDSGVSSGSMANLPSSSMASPLAPRKSIAPLPRDTGPRGGTVTPNDLSPTPVTLADLGATVYISGVQSGILRFYGETQFKSGVVWCGIELPLPQGTHDGEVDGIRYFKAKKNCGIFAPVEKVTLNQEKNGSNGNEMRMGGPLQPAPALPTQAPSIKGSKRPKSVVENDKTFTVAKLKVTSLTEQKKRRKLEVEEKHSSVAHPPPPVVTPGSTGSSSGPDNRNCDQEELAPRSTATSSVRVPNFAEINEVNLREEMERSVASSASPLTPTHSSTPRGAKVGFGSGSTELHKVFPLQLRRPSIIKTPTDGDNHVVFTPPQKTVTSLSNAPIGEGSGSRTYVIYSGDKHQPSQYQYQFQQPQSSGLCRPTSLGLDRGGSEEEEPPSEASSSDTGGLFGQKTPELWDGDGGSLAGLSSPEEAGIQEESSLGLGFTTPSQLFESWGDLKEDEIELYQHLRSPSIDELDFDDEDKTHNALEENDLLEDPLNSTLNNTLIPAPGYPQEEERPEKTDPIKPVDDQNTHKSPQVREITTPQPPQSDLNRHPDHQDHDQERCDSSVISASGYEAQTDSDFNTESDADHEELLLSHPTHTAPNKNRNARVIDGALYTSASTSTSTSGTCTATTASSQSQSSGSQITNSTSISTSEEPESSSSGFYSSSESGSLTRGGSRHPSNHRSASGSDCESSSNSTNNEGEAENEVTLLNSTSTTMSTTDVDGSAITTERNSPEEVEIVSIGHPIHALNISHSYEIGLDVIDLDGPFGDKKKGSTKVKKLKDDTSIRSGGSGKTVRGTKSSRDSIMNRSQSVSCLSSTSPGAISHGYNTRSKLVGSRSKEKAGGTVTGTNAFLPGTNTATTTTGSGQPTTNKTRVKGKHSSVLADTVASSSRRAAAVAVAAGGQFGVGLGHLGGGVGGRLSGSTQSLASSTSNLSSKSPGKKVGGGKWDSVMAKINEGKGKQINVKEVRAKVFDRLQGTGGGGSGKVGGSGSAKGSTSSLVGVGVGRKKPLRTEGSKDKDNKDVENEPTATKSGGGGGVVEGVKGTNSSNKRGVGGAMLQRTDSTSSDCSDHHGTNMGQRPQFTTKHRPKKENGPPRRQISDVSTASECSGSHSHSASVQPQTTTTGTTTQSKSKTTKKTGVTISDRPTSTSTSTSTSATVVASTGNKTSVATVKGSRTLSASGSASSTPQLKSPLRNSPSALKTKSKKTASATSTSTSTKSGVDVVAVAQPPLTSSNKGQSTKNNVAVTVSSAKSVKSNQSQQDPAVKPLRDHNRITTPGGHTNPSLKSKETVAPISKSRRRDDKDKDKESTTTVESLPTLREQLARVKLQLERLQSEDVLQKEEIQRLSNFSSQTLEERTRLGEELVECSKTVEAMTVVVRHTEEKNDFLTATVDVKNAKAAHLESLLRDAEEKCKQIPVLNGQLTAVHGIHRGEIRVLKRDQKSKLEKLVEDHNHELATTKETLSSYYDAKLAEKDRELEQIKESHRLEMESYAASHSNGSPHDVLLKDIASMSAVIEMQNQKVKELQTRVQILSMKEEELVKAENLGRTLSARVEDLEAQINSNKYDKTALLAQLTESEMALADAVSKNKCLIQNVDELTFKLNHPDIVPASPSACNFKESGNSNSSSLSNSITDSPRKSSMSHP